MVLTLSGREIAARVLQSEKACSPMEVTPAGTVSSVRFLQL